MVIASGKRQDIIYERVKSLGDVCSEASVCQKSIILIFTLRAAARIQSNLLCKFINSGSMYLGIYTREEKMCPQGAVFLQYSLESVVSSERLLGKR